MERWFILSWESYSIQRLGGAAKRMKLKVATSFLSLLFHPHFLLASPLCLSPGHTDPSRHRSHVPCTLDSVLLCHVASLPGMPTCLCLGDLSLNHGPMSLLGKAFPDVLGQLHSPLCSCGTVWLLFQGRCTRRNTVPLSVSPWPCPYSVRPQDYKMLQIVIYFIF